jgi:hypothetical protein
MSIDLRRTHVGRQRYFEWVKPPQTGNLKQLEDWTFLEGAD